jgi:signal transduction histidine kinase
MMPCTPAPRGHRPRPPCARRQALVAAAVLLTGPLSSWAAGPADGGTAMAAIVTVGAVAVALGALAAALAYRLGRRERPTPAPGPERPGADVPRAAAVAAPAGADSAAVEALAQALPGPAVLLRRGPDGWQLQHANAHAQSAAPRADAWPAGLREQLAAPPGQDTGATAPWQMLHGPGWLLAWQQQPADAASPAAADAARRAESESFGFTLSHDLRAPLRVVEGFTRIVKEDYGAQLDRVGNDHLERVLGAAARMNLMIDAMLALARLSQQPLSRQPVDLSRLAGFVVDELRRAAPERTVEIEIEPGLVADGDPTLLRLVLDNLLGNAWKYTAKAARPHIELRREAAPGTAALGFVVRDNGAGFDMRSADRLFGLFQRLHSASDFPGHGVGLASVRRIVERHGGRVWAESEPGRGASFHVVLGGA